MKITKVRIQINIKNIILFIAGVILISGLYGLFLAYGEWSQLSLGFEDSIIWWLGKTSLLFPVFFPLVVFYGFRVLR